MIGKRAVELGFTSTVGIIHDGGGQVQPLGDEERAVYHEMKSLEKRSFTRVNSFQDNIAKGKPNDWRCRAGRPLSLHLRKRTGSLLLTAARLSRAFRWRITPLEHLRREYLTEKCCAPHCTVSCVHQVSIFDSWRAPQHPSTIPASVPSENPLVQIE